MIRDDRQTLFFSATVSKEIRRLADSMLVDPAKIETAPESSTAELIHQRAYAIDRTNKPELLGRLLNQREVNRALVFTKTKHGADKLVKILHREKINAEAIHGNKTQNARTRALRRFKTGSTRVLIATDIASRGIDVDEITHVFNYDMPVDVETYVHRIGRTARAGASGIAISFSDRDELKMLRAIERRAKISIEVGEDHQDLLFDPSAPTRSRSRNHAPRMHAPSSGQPRRMSNDRPSHHEHPKPETSSAAKVQRKKSKLKSPMHEHPLDKAPAVQSTKKSKKTGYPRDPAAAAKIGKKKPKKNSGKPGTGVRSASQNPGGNRSNAKKTKRSVPW
jgi:ATP-dependent RNA helicase RhlE